MPPHTWQARWTGSDNGSSTQLRATRLLLGIDELPEKHALAIERAIEHAVRLGTTSFAHHYVVLANVAALIVDLAGEPVRCRAESEGTKQLAERYLGATLSGLRLINPKQLA